MTDASPYHCLLQSCPESIEAQQLNYIETPIDVWYWS